jgi:small subunit ribosomal protein S4e
MLDKMSGKWAPKPSAGPHKTRECLPLIVLIRNRLKYALNRAEVNAIMMQRAIKVDGKVRVDMNYPAGFMDVVSIERTNENFRLLYDVKGRFKAHKIPNEEARFKLCKIKRQQTGPRGIPYIVTHDGRTIRYPDPAIKVNDTVKIDLSTNKIVDVIKFEPGNLIMVTGGRNTGRVGIVVTREKHLGGYDIIHVKDAAGHNFSTRLGNIFAVGWEKKALISLPQGQGVKLSREDERERRLKAQSRV